MPGPFPSGEIPWCLGWCFGRGGWGCGIGCIQWLGGVALVVWCIYICICIYVCIYMYVCVCIYIYIYIVYLFSFDNWYIYRISVKSNRMGKPSDYCL